MPLEKQPAITITNEDEDTENTKRPVKKKPAKKKDKSKKHQMQSPLCVVPAHYLSNLNLEIIHEEEDEAAEKNVSMMLDGLGTFGDIAEQSRQQLLESEVAIKPKEYF